MSSNTSVQTNQQEKKLFADTNINKKTGRLARDPELVADGQFIKLQLANNKEYLDSNGEIKTTTNWFDVLVSSNLKTAFPVAQNLKQGDWIFAQGEDSSQSFDSAEGYKKTGNVIYAYKVVLRKAKADQQSENSLNDEAV